jgi:hypothetical protein
VFAGIQNNQDRGCSQFPEQRSDLSGRWARRWQYQCGSSEVQNPGETGCTIIAKEKLTIEVITNIYMEKDAVNKART